MTKDKKTYYYDRYTGSKWEVEGDFTCEEVVSYIKENWLDPHDKVIEDLNRRGILRELAVRYAHGEKHLVKRTAKARTEYARLFDDKLLPKDQRRRVLDVISARIKDVLPNMATRVSVETLLAEMPEASDGEIAQEMYEKVVVQKELHCLVPNAQFVKNIRAQLAKKDGNLDFELDAETKFVLSVSDQLADVARLARNRIALDIHMKRKKARLVFKLPDKARYMTGKVSLPDIVRTSRNASGIAFDFSIRHDAPEPYEPECSLGVDTGEIYPVVAALVGEGWHSQPFYPDGEVLDIVDKLEDLAFQKSVLGLKVEQNSKPGREMRPGQKASFEELVEADTVEMERLGRKMTDLKYEIARWSAHFTCETASSHKAQIILEKLNWSNPQHAFYHSLIRSAIVNLALVNGIPVVFVNAKDTSSRCPYDGEKLTQGEKTNPSAVRKSSKARNSWRSADRVSGTRDIAIRSRVAKLSGRSVFEVGFPEVASEHARNGNRRPRGAKCPKEKIVRDHDAIGALNIGVSGEVERGTRSSRHDLSGSTFRRVRRRDSSFKFGWAVMLSATAAVSATAPVTGLAGVSNDAVGLMDEGSPPS